MSRMRPLGEAPEMMALKLIISNMTTFSKRQFDRWYLDFRDELEDAFISSNEPDILKGVWLREVFVASRLLNSRPVADRLPRSELIPMAHQPPRSSSTRPAGNLFSRMFRRSDS